MYGRRGIISVRLDAAAANSPACSSTQRSRNGCRDPRRRQQRRGRTDRVTTSRRWQKPQPAVALLLAAFGSRGVALGSCRARGEAPSGTQRSKPRFRPEGPHRAWHETAAGPPCARVDSFSMRSKTNHNQRSRAFRARRTDHFGGSCPASTDVGPEDHLGRPTDRRSPRDPLRRVRAAINVTNPTVRIGVPLGSGTGVHGRGLTRASVRTSDSEGWTRSMESSRGAKERDETDSDSNVAGKNKSLPNGCSPDRPGVGPEVPLFGLLRA